VLFSGQEMNRFSKTNGAQRSQPVRLIQRIAPSFNFNDVCPSDVCGSPDSAVFGGTIHGSNCFIVSGVPLAQAHDPARHFDQAMA
jgi:hypothetical protein